jgi:hypothetical protein
MITFNNIKCIFNIHNIIKVYNKTVKWESKLFFFFVDYKIIYLFTFSLKIWYYSVYKIGPFQYKFVALWMIMIHLAYTIYF